MLRPGRLTGKVRRLRVGLLDRDAWVGFKGTRYLRFRVVMPAFHMTRLS